MKKFSFIYIILLFVVLFLNSNKTQAQTVAEMDLLKEAYSALDKELYDSAVVLYGRLQEINKWNFEYVFGKGYALYYSSGRRKKEAIVEFEKIVKYRRVNQFPETNFFLGRCYHYTGDFTKAAENYNQFFKYIEDTKAGKELRSTVNTLIKQAFMASNTQRSNEGLYQVENVGEEINSSADEFNPIITSDDKSLVYISKQKKEEGTTNQDYSFYYYYNPEKDIYMSNKNGAVFSEGQSIGDKVVMNPSIVEVKGDRFLFYEGEYGDLNIIDPNTDTVYLSLDRKGGFGGKDIYLATRNENGDIGNITNLGEVINGKEDEVTPFYDYKKNTLYYSSSSFDGLGGLDIYKSVKNNGQWSKPKNLGYPINTPFDDLSYTVNKSYSGAYYASSKEEGFGGMDIYYIQFMKNLDSNDNEPNIIEDNQATANQTVYDIKVEEKKEEIPVELAQQPTQEKNIKSFQDKNSVHTYLKKIIEQEKIKNPSLKVNTDTIHLVQIGAYKKDMPVSYFAGFKEVIAISYDDGINRYYVAPPNNDKNAAGRLQKRAIILGYKDAFLTYFMFK